MLVPEAACAFKSLKALSVHGTRSIALSQDELPDMQSGLHTDTQTRQDLLHDMPCRQVAASRADLISSRVRRSWVLSQQYT